MGHHRSQGNEEMLTARLSLRRSTPADTDAIYRIHSNPRACAHNPSDALANRLEAEDCDGRWQEHWQQHGFGYWTIRRRTGPATDEPLGFCGGQHRRAAGPRVPGAGVNTLTVA